MNFIARPINHSVIDSSYATYDPQFAQHNDPTGVARVSLRGMISLLVDLSARAGNIHGADGLFHWLFGNGMAINDYNVDQMLKDLHIFQEDAYDQMTKSSSALILQHPELAFQAGHISGCKAWTFNTWNPNHPRHWTRVGKSSDPNPVSTRDRDIYPNVNTDLSDLSRFTHYDGADFDWFIALNAFNYTVAEGIVLDERTGDIEICYKVYIEDHYGWYNHPPHTGNVDAIMSRAEQLGIGKNYSISGVSSTTCVKFKISEIGRYIDPTFKWLGGF